MPDAKMKTLSEWGFLLLILAFGLFLRLATNPAPLSGIIGADGFFHSWLVSETLSSGSFPVNDPFSWGGRLVSYFPGFHLFFSAILLSSGLANFFSIGFLLSWGGPLLFSLSFFTLAVFSKKSGINPIITCSIFSALPILVWKTSMNFLPDSLVLVLAIFLFFIQKNSPDPVTFLLLSAGLLSHPIFLFVAAVGLAYGFRKNLFVKSLGISALALLTMFSLLFLAGKIVQFPSSPGEFFSQNIPSQIRPEIFEGFDIGKIAYRLGPAILPFILQFPMNFLGFFALLIPAAMRIIELDRALFFSAIFLIPAAATFISRRKRFAQTLFILAILIWAAFSMKALAWAPLSKGDFNSLGWISENSDESGQILSLPGDGYLVSYVSGRKNSIDGRFSGTSKGNELLNSILLAIKNPGENPPPGQAELFIISSRTKYVSPAPEWSLLCESLQKEGVYYFPYSG